MSPDVPEVTLDGMREAITELPTIPETLTRILQLLEDPNSGARDLAEVIRNDPPLASKILRLANSPLYQKNRSITTIQECVSVLGYRTVRQVALCVAVVSSLGKECADRAATLDYRDLWRHCVAVGTIAHFFARIVRHDAPETVFTGGLLHDLGKFLLAICNPRRYGEVIERRRQLGQPLVEVERAELGFDHAEAGRALADHWHFPPELLSMIEGHHAPGDHDHSVALVALADCVANTLTPATSDLGFASDLVGAAELYGRAGITRQQVEDIAEDLVQAVADAAPLAQLD